MAAINPGPLQLAMPAPPVASFVQAFNDPSKDPLHGQYAGLYDSSIDPNNAQVSYLLKHCVTLLLLLVPGKILWP